MILVSQWYTPSSEKRQSELRRCRSLNEASPLLDKVDYVDGDSHRWTFGELVSRCNELYPGEVCVIANADIRLDTAVGLRDTCRAGRLVALTRWESSAGPRFLGHQANERFFSGSQDTWAFVAASLPTVDVEIPMGLVACDQMIAGWAVSRGVEVVNPALSICTLHVHADTSRPDRASVYGYYGYPELTTAATTGSVLCHHWPNKSGKYEFEWELRQ